jgi:outer membrane receptor protein involved in Fe transport
VISLTEVAGVPYLTPPLEDLKRLNVSLGIGDEDAGWNLRLIGQNLTDQKRYGFALPIPFVAAPPGQQSSVGVPLNPRTIALQFSIKM